ncbi:MAG: hypothetical protein ACXAE3_17610 [Candidatus Kariarchaeaceae archaeon]|jgi:hypothetical protein
MAKESSWEQVARILILIDGILMFIGGIFAVLGALSLATLSLPIPDVPGNSGFGAGFIPALDLLVTAIIMIIIGIVYISHFTGKIRMDSALMNGILFLILSLVFGGLLTILGSIFYIIAALT